MKKHKILILISIFMIVFTACSSNLNKENDKLDVFDPTKIDYKTVPLARLELENGDIIRLALFPEIAPNTVNNFIELSSSGFYDGLIFHRVISDFMIQGGDPLANGMGDPGYSIKGEFASNGFENNLSHVRGVLSMARSKNYDSAGSQFFIMQADYDSLDGDYAAFGYVIEGLDVLDKIASVDTGKRDLPKEPIIIKTIKIELNDYEVAEVAKLEE